MKNRMPLVLAAILSSCFVVCQTEHDDSQSENALAKVVLRFVEADLESPIGVGCNNLESYWGSAVDTLVVFDRPFLDSLGSIVARLRQSKKGFIPDARIVVEMYSSDGVKRELCMSNIALALDGQEMQFEPPLLSLVQTEIARQKK